jgi:IPT/TIG domain
MVRHDPHGHSGEPDPPGTPGVRALGAMAAAARRAREAQEGGPPTRAAEVQFEDEPLPRPPAPESLPRETATRRSPLEVAVWVVAAMILVAAGALAVSLATSGSGGGPSDAPPTSAHTAAPTTPHGTPGGKGGGPSTSPGSSSTTTTAATAVPPNASGPPVIAALNPASGSAGQAIQVAGANFLSSSGQIIATFDGQVASTSCPAQNTCSVTVPPAPSGSPTAQVVITTAGGTSNTLTFTYG